MNERESLMCFGYQDPGGKGIVLIRILFRLYNREIPSNNGNGLIIVKVYFSLTQKSRWAAL